MQATTVAVDGGLFEHFDAYRGFLREYLDLLLTPEVSHLLADASSPFALAQPPRGRPLPFMYLVVCRSHLHCE